MKKVLLMNVLYKPNIGGIENSISEISKVLISNDYKVDIFCSNRNNEDRSHLGSIYEEGKSNIFRYNYEYGKFSFFKKISAFNSLLKIGAFASGVFTAIFSRFFLASLILLSVIMISFLNFFEILSKKSFRLIKTFFK